MGGGIKAGLMVAAMTALLLASPGTGRAQSGMRAGAGHSRGATTGIAATSFHSGRSGFSSMPQVPGLGFDYVHLAAVGGRSSGSFSRDARDRFITPIFTGVVPFYPFVDDDSLYAQPQQPSVIVVQQPLQTIVVQQPAPQSYAAPQPPPDADAAAPASPLPDVGEFVIVRRDGQLLFAPAFTTTGGRLTYITWEGVRRSFPLAELDKDATLQMNEANGSTIVLPE